MSAGGISRSGRVRKKSAKLMEMETRDSSESEGKPRLIKGKSIEKSIGLSDTEPPISKKAALIRTPKTQAPTGNLPFKKKSSKIVSQIVFQTTDQTESGSDIDEDIQEDVSVKNEVEEHGVDRVSATSDVQFKAEFEVKLEPEELLMSEDENSLIDPVGSDSDCDPEIKTDSSLCSFEEPFLKNETDLQMNDKETEQQVLASSNGYIVPDKIGEVLSLEFGDTSTIKDESDIMMNNAEAGLQSSNRRKQLLQPITEDKMEQIQPILLTMTQSIETDSDTNEQTTETRPEESQPRSKRKQVLQPLKDPGEEQATTIDHQPPQKKSSDEKKRTKDHVCDQCGVKFVMLKKLKLHKKDHKKQKKLRCAICLLIFDNLGDWCDHSFAHAFNCVVCKKSFSNARSLTRHIITHPGMKPYKCSHCGLRFSSHVKCKVHERDNHVIPRNEYTCFACKKEFDCLDNLQLHKCVHTHNHPFKCCYCTSSFMSFSSLSSHTQSSHSNSEEHKCEECGINFETTHLLIHHIYFTKTKCGICQQELLPGCAVIKHMKSHIRSVQSYSCKVCKSSFSNRNVAHKHVRDHHPAELDYVKHSRLLINYQIAE